jgi:type II secretory pathway component GspD/PulD (secretin)
MRRTSSRLVGIPALALAALLLAAPSVLAMGPNLDKRLAVNFTDAPAQEAIARIAADLVVDVQLDRSVNGRVTLVAPTIRAKTALDAVCESLGCRWSFLPGTAWILSVVPASPEQGKVEPASLHSPLTLKLHGVDIKDFLRAFGAMIGMEMRIDPKVAGTVDVDANDTGQGGARRGVPSGGLLEVMRRRRSGAVGVPAKAPTRLATARLCPEGS